MNQKIILIIVISVFILLYHLSAFSQNVEAIIPPGLEVDIGAKEDKILILYFWEPNNERFPDLQTQEKTKMGVLREKYKQEWSGFVEILTATAASLPQVRSYLDQSFRGRYPFPILDLQNLERYHRPWPFPYITMIAPDGSVKDINLVGVLDPESFLLTINEGLQDLGFAYFRWKVIVDNFNTLQKLRRWLDELERIGSVDANKLADAYNMLGLRFKTLDRWQEARTSFIRALQLGSRAARENLSELVKPGGLSIRPSNANIEIGKELNFTVQGLNHFNQEIPNLPVEWRLKDGKIGIIDENGNFRAISIGEDTLIAICQGEVRKATIVVTSAQATSFSQTQDSRWLKLPSIFLPIGAVLSGTFAVIAHNNANDELERVPIILSDERVSRWGNYTKFQTRADWYGWTAANLGISALPFLFDWTNKRPRIGKWWVAGFFFAGSAAFGTYALISKNEADDAYNKIPTQLSEDRVICWGEYNKSNESVDILAANAIIDFVTAIGVLLWYDRKDETAVRESFSDYFNRHRSLRVSLDLSKDWIFDRRISLIVQKSF